MDAQSRATNGRSPRECFPDRSTPGRSRRNDAGSDLPSQEPHHAAGVSLECGEIGGGKELSPESPAPSSETTGCFLSKFGDSELGDFSFMAENIQSVSQKCSTLLSMFRKELSQAKKFIRPKDKSSFLFEVMCSENSELTRQCWMQNLKARRFGLREGDLRTKASRQNLFAHVVAERPEHLWISPECRPWCKWSEFNSARSEESLFKILQERETSLWQICLAIVLCEFQVEQEHHFHLEQPFGSLMLKCPVLKPIHQVTRQCSFDLCLIGNLKDPMTMNPIRKRLVVCTTSPTMFDALNARFCRGEHKHQQIAGSTKLQGKSMPLSRFTEFYPRKFARQIVQLLRRPCVYCFAGESEHPSKRRRLGDKSSKLSILLQREPVTWDHIMKAVDAMAKRVGVQVVEGGMLIEAIQKLTPDHDIKHVVLCRGTDRMLGPCKTLIPGQAPVRRMVCIRRRFEDLFQEENWETWENLSARQLRRKTVSARCNMTIFAKPKAVETQAPDVDSQRDPPVNASAIRTPEPMSKRARVEPDREPLNPDEAQSPPERMTVDLVSQKHGPEFLKLSVEERNWLLKIHRNMGHPGAQKLQTYCKQIGCSDVIVKAIPHIKCSTCEETKSPTIPRPSAIHEHLDFGDIVSTDGVTFVNSKGQEFHFYHFIDHGTNFHIAKCAPSRTAEDAIRTLAQGWIHWAGPPGMLCADSAGEFIAPSYEAFLQKHGIKLRVIPPESHWQNARVERHGGILQEMLRKMDLEETIDSYEKLEIRLSFATQTKNQWSKYRGFPPEVLVFGRMQRIPGSVMSDPDMASHAKALSEMPDGIRFRSELLVREQARKAFCQIDNEQSFRRALVQRSRPARGPFQKGDWVMMWRKDSSWLGPMKVIVHEDQKRCLAVPRCKNV